MSRTYRKLFSPEDLEWVRYPKGKHLRSDSGCTHCWLCSVEAADKKLNKKKVRRGEDVDRGYGNPFIKRSSLQIFEALCP